MRGGPSRPTMKDSAGPKRAERGPRGPAGASGVDALDVDDARVLSSPDEVADEHLALVHGLLRRGVQQLRDADALQGVRDSGVEQAKEGRQHGPVAAERGRVTALEQTLHLTDGPDLALREALLGQHVTGAQAQSPPGGIRLDGRDAARGRRRDDTGDAVGPE